MKSNLSTLGSKGKTDTKHAPKSVNGPAQTCKCGAIKPSDYIFCDECGNKL